MFGGCINSQTENWVLTAGHCRLKPGDVVKWGRWNIAKAAEVGGEVAACIETYDHPLYDYNSASEQ